MNYFLSAIAVIVIAISIETVLTTMFDIKTWWKNEL